MADTVFLSVGSQSNEQQVSCVEAIKLILREEGLETVTADGGARRPFDSINEKMKKSDGVVVLALERYFAPKLIERRNATIRETGELNDVCMPTTWNQVETAFAHAWKLPLLVFCEDRLRRDALIDRGADWSIHPIIVERLDTEYVRKQVKDFAALVKKRRRPLWQVLRQLDAVGQVGLASSVAGLMAVTATAAFYFGRISG